MRRISAVTFASAVALAAPAAAASQPMALVTGGKIAGTSAEGVNAFKGVPFAAPPTGALRWRAPQPVVPWKGVRDATQYGHDCMQLPFPSDAAPLGTTPSEDCLVVNVWAPADAAGKKLPVLFWIYGGGFVNGGSSPAVYDGAAIARRGVVFVSANYRVGRFGFFAHPALAAAGEAVGGNFGLMDQQAALRWTRDNAAAFGGDPARITVIGESAGGMSVLSLMGSKAARDLFSGAVIMSGGGRSAAQLRDATTDRPNMPSAQAIGQNFARSVGIEGVDTAALAQLRALPAEKIVSGLNLASMFMPQAGPPTYTGPFIDGITLTDSVEGMFRSAAEAPVPVMVGATSADIGIVPVRDKQALFATFGANADKARQMYDPDGNRSFLETMLAVGGDRFMVEPARFVAGEVTRAGRPAYHYRFSYVADSIRQPGKGAAHASDIPFFLDTAQIKYGAATTAADREVAHRIADYVVNFARNGNPNGAGLPEWVPYRAGRVMDFSASGQPVDGNDPLTQRLDLAMPEQGAK